LRAWIDTLTPAGRLILLLHFGDGLEAGDIADLVGLAEVTVAQQLGAFRRRARAILNSAEGVHERG
jgi:DNA-directed RNA polymerase specialized sigma24 family protein